MRCGVVLLAARRAVARRPRWESALAGSRAQQGGGVQVAVPDGRASGAAPAPRRTRTRGEPPPGPPPRSADGRVLLGGATPAIKGVWLPGEGGAQEPAMPRQCPSSRGRERCSLIDESTNWNPIRGASRPAGSDSFSRPTASSSLNSPSSSASTSSTSVGRTHTALFTWMDGRIQRIFSRVTTVTPSVGGKAIRSVVDTTGFNESFWIDRRGMPHTEKLRMLERFTRVDTVTIKYEVTIDDPGAYTAPWKTGFNLRWEDGTELFEYVCQQSNYAPTLMVGGETSIDRSSAIVP